MKRLTALLLSLALVFSLLSCSVKPGKTGEDSNFTNPEPVTLSDGRTVYSTEPFVEFPQTGEYKETALLTNVPGQGAPLLLDMRDDGTIDYIFADVEKQSDFQTFAACGAAYYTIAPDGTATKQDAKWMEDLDNYLRQTLEADQDPNGKWRFLFAAEEGTILILGQYHNIVQSLNPKADVNTRGKILYSTLFKVENGQVIIVPIQWKVEIGTNTLDLSTQYISSVELTGGEITVNKRADLEYKNRENFCTVTYRMDGTAVSARSLYDKEDIPRQYVDDSGLIVCSLDFSMLSHLPELSATLSERDHIIGDYWRFVMIPDTDSGYIDWNTLYYYEKDLTNIKVVGLGGGKDFCVWFDEAGTGVLMRYTYNPEGRIEPEVLTVWSLSGSSVVDAAVAQWNSTHSSPIFRHESASTAMQFSEDLTMDEILTRLHLQLLNNQGPDVMILDGLNVDNYLEFMAPLDRVNTEGIYGAILDRFTVGNDLLAVSARISPYLLGRAAEGTEDITSLRQFADVVEANTPTYGTDEDGRPITKSGEHLYCIEDYAQIFRLWYPAWAEAIWEGGKLNKEVFVEFLTQTTRLSDLYGLYDYGEAFEARRILGTDPRYRQDFFPYLRDTDGNMVVEHFPAYDYTLAATRHVGLYSYWRYANADEANEKPDPHYLSGIPGPDGTGVMVPVTIAGVRAGGNEAAGQEFIQLLLSREMQLGNAYHYPYHATGYPVFWEYTEELLERMEDYMHQDYAVQNDYEALMGSLRAVVIDKFLFEAAMAAAKSCYRLENRLTPEEAAEDLYEATRIYLAELR